MLSRSLALACSFWKLLQSVADSLLAPLSKIASKASVTFARSSSEITLLFDSGASFLFVAAKNYVEEAWPIVDPVLKADTPV